VLKGWEEQFSSLFPPGPIGLHRSYGELYQDMPAHSWRDVDRHFVLVITRRDINYWRHEKTYDFLEEGVQPAVSPRTVAFER
jgi:hypothetical protein